MSNVTPKHSILKTLNEAQCKAVCSQASTVAILAGPGSGKTHTLTSRVVWLVDAVGYQPEDIIVATFTVKAAREMKERIGKALGNDRERKLVLGTFHSIARRYLAAYGQCIGLNPKFAIADDADSRAIIQRICKRYQLACEPVIARAWISKKKAKGTEVKASAKRQSENTAVHSRDLDICYEKYQSHLEQSNLLDYDDLLVRCVELLRQCPSCVSNIQAVLIDEYQDTNGVQYELMKLFAQKHQRITIVGDPDQSIYGWRSAEIRNLYRMLKDYPGTDEVALEENYRSSQSILDISLQVIQQDKKRYQKVLRPIHDKGTRPVLRKLKTSSMEGEWIVSEIRRIHGMSGQMVRYDDIAILLRSASLSRHIEAALGKAGIAYKMVGGFKFYERAEIKTIVDYLRVIHQPDNNDAVARVINVPKRGIGDMTIKALIEEAEKSSLSLWKLLEKHCRGDRTAKTNIKKQTEQKISGEFIRLIKGARERNENPSNGTPFALVDLIDHVLTRLSFQKFLQDTYPEEHELRWANVQEFMNLASDFARDLEQGTDEDLPEIEGLQQMKESDILGRFLANVSLASDVQTNEDPAAKTLVTISTIHAAKGLEWPVVFVPAAYNGSIPHSRSNDADEERRLLYVAMTRAKALLYLSCPLYSSQGNGEKLELSPFLEPISSTFDKKGPSLERHRMTQLGKIIQREVPSEKNIYGSLPPLFSVEDDQFPIDPEQLRQLQRSSSNSFNGSNGERSRLKRQKLYGPAGSREGEEDPGWSKEYSTTMEQASNFTISSLPGFMSASAPELALAAAAAASKESRQVQGSGIKRMTNKRPADQRSLLGFVKKDGNQPPEPSTNKAPSSVPPRVLSHAPSRTKYMNRPAGQIVEGAWKNKAPATIPADLGTHKLAKGNLVGRPSRKVSDETPPSGYAQFSSSPTRPTTSGTDVVGKDADQDDGPPPEPTRTATCLHATTVTVPSGYGGFKRPAGLTREGIAPIDRLRKPFKPLTIMRNH